MIRNTFIIRFLFLFLSVGFSAQTMFAQDAAKGQELFLGKCASCHNANMKDKSTGPALGGVQDRWSDPKKLYAWIRNSAAFLATGDAYANKLYAEYNKSNMTAFPNLTDTEIADILAYVDKKYTTPVQGPQDPKGPKGMSAASSGLSTNSLILISLLVLALLVTAFSLSRVAANLTALAHEKETGVKKKPISIWESLTSKPVIGLLIFAGIILLSYTTVSNATTLGRQQGYAPEQPIKFSHALHAGKNKIDCNYCHDGARRSKHSVIPGTATCMNCHTAVKKGPQYGTEEINKIYEYAGYNSAKAIYDKPGKPIEWVRIHNLPDHVYFNHAQHVTVGKVACQECHGKVEEMEKVQQYATLSMGWCVNCHRKTAVKFDENKFYAGHKMYEDYHKALKAGTKDKVTVEDIGGLECQKCHY